MDISSKNTVRKKRVTRKLVTRRKRTPQSTASNRPMSVMMNIDGRTLVTPAPRPEPKVDEKRVESLSQALKESYGL